MRRDVIDNVHGPANREVGKTVYDCLDSPDGESWDKAMGPDVESIATRHCLVVADPVFNFRWPSPELTLELQVHRNVGDVWKYCPED